MRLMMSSSILLAAGLALAVPAMAQPPADTGAPTVVSSQPVPDTAREAPGIPGPEAVNPAPGAPGPYVGAGRQGFYDVDTRIASITQGVQSLPGSQRRRAAAQLKAIRAEEATQKARHGQLRDWDRENLNAKMDRMVQQFPSLSASASAAPPMQ